MKYTYLLTISAALLSACATPQTYTSPTNSCISTNSAHLQPINFGSNEAKQAYDALPNFSSRAVTDATALEVVAQVSSALENFDLPPEGETAFLRRRKAAYSHLLDPQGIRADIERLIVLDQLHPNEKAYFATKLDDPTLGQERNLDRDAQPLVRVPPRMSPKALMGDHSGHCLLKFDVSQLGEPKNIRAAYCTRDVFRDSSIQSLALWKYNPAIRNGAAVKRKDVETRIAYIIQDSCGRQLPE